MRKHKTGRKAFTVLQRKMARAGYCYSQTQYKNGLKSIVRELDGMSYNDIIFDQDAYETHKEIGLIK